ncbi:MAG: DUF1284 domain-containing protein [Clostridiaceae bacterium]
MEDITIRPHHLLCMQGFQGYGYDEEFAIKMKEIIDKIAECKYENIVITKGIDDICKTCPNNNDGICDKDDSVSYMDNLLISKLNINYGVKFTKLEENIFDIINNKLTQNDIEEICLDCMWSDVCTFYKK